MDIISLVVGAAIGLVASFLTIVMQRALDGKGKLNIYYRFIYQKGFDGRSWEFSEKDGNLHLIIPVVYEFQNTSNTTRVIRDVALFLYKGKHRIGKMVQIDRLHTKEKDYYFGAEKGSYSFVLQPRSIQKQECEYCFKIALSDKEEMSFDRIMLQYYDERNRAKVFFVREIQNCWEKQQLQADRDWVKLETIRFKLFTEMVAAFNVPDAAHRESVSVTSANTGGGNNSSSQ